ncbi:neither inactivation nor afterpotential protein G-like isoform X1 [Schistocerca nitens]|uniref:neither inactivation nor afterpotential protein G-like isoform X1 n=1 Tax=Schistocerca nitens TaxID=7011 RepID=UPI0021178980|nr:neither inactivation nor afterpotential protein G-like isoform X1 [Schistocerca nitens]
MMQYFKTILNMNLTLTVLILIVSTLCSLAFYSKWMNKWEGIIQHPKSEYDYIIVGAGTAGCVLASRLSSESHASVLLIEAGGVPNWLSSVPLAAPLLQGSQSECDWAYRTLPQKHSSWGLKDQVSAWPRGRGLGGSGQINYMVHSLGHPNDFKHWEENGAKGWGLSSMQTYLDKLEGSCMPTTCGIKNGICHKTTEKMQSQTIPLNTVDPEEMKLADAFLNAGKELELPNGEIKFNLIQSTIHKGERWSSLHGYLLPALGQTNLEVLLNTAVSKVTVTREAVTGVELDSGVRITARQEVVLSAGSINTPQILLRSGIGPRQHLDSLGIPVVSDLPVGMNLHDHMNMPLYVSIDAPYSVTIDKIKSVQQIWDYFFHGKGLFATTAVLASATLVPDAGLILFGLGSADEKILKDIANYKSDTFQGLFPLSHNSSQEGFVLLATCLTPQSRGRLWLNVSHLEGPPIIEPNYLSHSHDIPCMIKAINLAEKLVRTKAFQKLGAQLHLPVLSECRNLIPDVRDLLYLECIIRTAAVTAYHPGGTCKMGSLQNNSTVVDNLLRVHGVQGLRVMDASILPTPLSGHPNSVLIAMADRASSFILNTP